MEKKTIERLCPFKMLGREEEWLNDILQQGWLINKKGDFIYTFEKCSNTAQYIRLCNAWYLDEEIRVNPEFKKGRLLFQTVNDRIPKDNSQTGMCYFLFADDTEERVNVSLTNRYKWERDEISAHRMILIILAILVFSASCINEVFEIYCTILFVLYLAVHIARHRRYRILLKQMKNSENTEQRSNE